MKIITTPFKYNDGGRKKAGYKGDTGDCVVRAISIITKKPYQKVYDDINIFAQTEKITKKRKTRSSARTGIYKTTTRKYLLSLGFQWTPTMFIGSGCKFHLCKEEMPKGRLIISVSKHITAMIDGVINDTYQPAREGTRCVYGYWQKIKI